MKYIEGGVTAAKGFSAGGMYCGIRKNKSKPDLAMIYSSAPCAAAGMYTSNLVKGAPILVTKRNLENGIAHAVICNSGNANTCNADGEEKAWSMCEIAGKALHIDPHDVIVASTGVIGQVLPIEPIADTAPLLAASLTGDGSSQAARAIMTTDTVVKEAAAELEIGGKTVRLGGICKGSGMIHPNMCTMLCFLTTDAAVSAPVLDKALRAVVADTFNMVSIDGDTSTNDTITIMANGLAENPEIQANTAEYEAFEEALRGICTDLARKMAKDGEGATKAARLQGQRGGGSRFRPQGCQECDLLEPAQGRHVRRRRQLGPRTVRHRLRRNGHGHFQSGRLLPLRGRHDRRVPERLRHPLQRGGSQEDPFRRRDRHSRFAG